MTELSEEKLGEFSVTEGRRSLDNQLNVIQNNSDAAIELIKSDFIIATILIGAAQITVSGFPPGAVWAMPVIFFSAVLSMTAYLSSVVQEPHYGLTIDLSQISNKKVTGGLQTVTKK